MPSETDVQRLALFDEIEADLQRAARAMERLDEGNYDICEVCGNALNPETRMHSPLDLRCAACADRTA